MLAARANPAASVLDDFVKLCLRAMERLKHMGRYNLVYGLVCGLGTMREDGSDLRLPTRKSTHVFQASCFYVMLL